MVDLFKVLDLPVMVVSRSGLGTINHTLMTIECLRARDIAIEGVVMNGARNEENELAIEKEGDVKVVASLPVWESLRP